LRVRVFSAAEVVDQFLPAAGVHLRFT
jgi:hypothetical protein